MSIYVNGFEKKCFSSSTQAFFQDHPLGLVIFNIVSELIFYLEVSIENCEQNRSLTRDTLCTSTWFLHEQFNCFRVLFQYFEHL